jgi:hypothetical protein
MAPPKKYLTEEERIEARKLSSQKYYQKKTDKVKETASKYYYDHKEYISEQKKIKKEKLIQLEEIIEENIKLHQEIKNLKEKLKIYKK